MLSSTRRLATLAIVGRPPPKITFDPLRILALVKTQAEDIFRAISSGTVSTNVYLRRVHNFALDMNWLLGPVVVRRHWPKIKFREKRAITLEEHRRIVEREGNAERRAFYELCWHLGGAQTDIASLHGEDIDWATKSIAYERRKLKGRGLRPSVVQFGPAVERILVTLPAKGPLFPYLITVRSADRATEFGQRCRGLGITGVTLHSYRYAWAERAGRCGFPERFAMQSLGHNSKAVHHGYARKALVVIPSLQEYEEAFAASQANIIPLQLQQARSAERHHGQGSFGGGSKTDQQARVKRAGLVRRRRSGRVHRLKLEARPMREAQQWLEEYRRFWEERFDRLDDYLIELQTKEKT